VRAPRIRMVSITALHGSGEEETIRNTARQSDVSDIRRAGLAITGAMEIHFQGICAVDRSRR